MKSWNLHVEIKITCSCFWTVHEERIFLLTTAPKIVQNLKYMQGNRIKLQFTKTACMLLHAKHFWELVDIMTLLSSYEYSLNFTLRYFIWILITSLYSDWRECKTLIHILNHIFCRPLLEFHGANIFMPRDIVLYANFKDITLILAKNTRFNNNIFCKCWSSCIL